MPGVSLCFLIGGRRALRPPFARSRSPRAPWEWKPKARGEMFLQTAARPCRSSACFHASGLPGTRLTERLSFREAHAILRGEGTAEGTRAAARPRRAAGGVVWQSLKSTAISGL